MDPTRPSSSHKTKNYPDVEDSAEKSSKGLVDKYFLDLEKWLNDAYMWQGVAASFPYFLMCNQYMSHYSTVNGSTNTTRNPSANEGSTFNIHGFVGNQNRAFVIHGIQAKVPALWKRLLAEFLDFLILFIFKLAVTWIAIDFFEIIDLSKFDLDGLQLDMKKMDYRVALQMTHNIMILEVIHRFVVCIFETLFLMGGFPDGRIGGATPGKSMMGLRVVRCENLIEMENEDMVIVYPGTELGLGWSFARSFIKNLVLAVFIPFIVAFYYFPCNRAGYDMVCNTIVVEEPIIPHRLHQQ